MKKQKIFNFALSVTCAAVLSACGSSGGGSLAVENTPTTPSANANANTGSDNSAALTAAQKAAQEAAAKQAAAEEAAKKAQAEADKAKADAANTVQDAQNKLNDAVANLSKALEDAKQQGKDELLAEQEEAKRKAEEAEKNAAAEKANPFNQKYLLQNTPAKEGESFVGLKHVVKNNSNLATNSSLVKDSTSDIPTMMTVQGPQRSLDTIVVAERLATPAGDKASRTYLEDFDTRTLNNGLWQNLNDQAHTDGHKRKKDTNDDIAIGNSALQNIYINSITTVGGSDSTATSPAIEAERRALDKAVSDAKRQLTKLQEPHRTTQDNFDKFKTTLSGFKSNVGTDDNPIPVAPTTTYNAETERLTKIIKTDTSATLVMKQRAQQELDILTNKYRQLEDAFEKTKAPLVDQQLVIDNAENKLNKFNAENPPAAPANVVAIDKQRAIDDTTGNTFGVLKNADGTTALYETKTRTMGTKIGGVWTFSNTDINNRHQNFTEYSEKKKDSPNVVTKGFVISKETKDLNGNYIVSRYDTLAAVTTAEAGDPMVEFDPDNPTPRQTPVNQRSQDNTVAEIYGYRSKALGSYEKPLDEVDNVVEPANNTTPANNLPLVNDYKGAKLQHVQYGRVTSALSDRTSTGDFYKDGIKMNDATKTYVASFGEYGEEGTENHFFFRGVNNVGGTELTKLKESTKNGVITYEGHAVTYGLNNNFMGNRDIPTALGNGSGFVSGNHAKAEVNLATNAVTGSIFNKWYDPASPKALRDIDLVQFKGTIADNGNIAGDALRVDNQTTGLFGAALYGAGAEMGGTVASHDKAAGKHWGGVFGAIRKGVEEAPKQSPQDANSVDQRPQLP